ncbi:class I poly(R)-hydroxyalkanoic acid synthase [Phyllobacterium salinisoli]|uniref:Class I poly(R)-hydroxyalkanoic acid synthase n=1 Tax=Phyllobacterium salinisoli TaxID=1899321 RepID=A0A368K438_9HYPH|nr:class I poly(R)-hydroxyalkanoic acid synthase [Phyllobacterium salinisoli]RCS24148.1 class I poly(R)-hydroxyalkanoic acid synthase [Phyllobacterium salinisoli]
MSDPRDPSGKNPPGEPSLDDYLIKDPSSFALNLARMIEQAGKAASAWIEPREKGLKNDLLADPMTDMVKTLSKLSEYWLSDPVRALEAQTRLFSSFLAIWTNSIRRMAGETTEAVVTPDPKDKRFQDEDWTKNAFFDFLKQVYLVTGKWALDLVERTEGLDDHSRLKATFYVRQIINAASPTNFILTNPELFKETVASNGLNLVYGMQMLTEDIIAGKGDLRLRQADHSYFRLGENLATTPGKVVARNDLAEIIQYAPTTEKVFERPLLICPPWINKYYILDLSPEKSLIRWLVDQGHTVFVISWVNPDARHADKDWEAYIREGIQFGLDTVERRTGERKINAIGYCVGGTLLSAALALMAREGDDRVKSATFFTTQVDFEDAGDLKVFVDEEQISALEKAMFSEGYLDGMKMLTAFNMLRSSDLIWPYVVNNYMRGKDPLPFDLLYWNADATRLSAANHSFYLRNCYLENRLSRGKMVLAGHRISLADINIPIYSLAAKEDHIAPAPSVFTGSQCFGGDVTYVLAGSGHIAGVINPPQKRKYQYWTGGKAEGDLQDWLNNAQEHPGSWWPHWQEWIENKGAKKVFPRHIQSNDSDVLDDAPGFYVRLHT